jgi:histidinol-phosphate/aromatic aminotransferase/cobyric acid decarboxylase-like protein
MNNLYNINNLKKCIKLDLNEYDFNHHPGINTILIDTINNEKNLTHYSNKNNNFKILLELLKKKNNIENILLTGGSDNALEYIVNTFVDNNKYILIFVPSYIYFNVLVQNKTNKIIYIPVFDNNCNLDLCFEFYSDIMDNAIIYIVNPNNPLGTYYSVENIENVISKYNKTLFILDEAYIEFYYDKTCIHLTNIYNKLIITKE